MCTSKCTCILKFQGSSSILLLLHLKNPHHLHLLRHALLKWRWMEAEVMGFGMPASSVQSLNHIFIFWRGLTRNLKIVFTALHTCSVVSLCGPADYSTPGSPVHGIFQARRLEWVTISSSRGSSQLRDWTQVSCVSCTGRQNLYHRAAWEASNSFIEI